MKHLIAITLASPVWLVLGAVMLTCLVIALVVRACQYDSPRAF